MFALPDRRTDLERLLLQPGHVLPGGPPPRPASRQGRPSGARAAGGAKPGRTGFVHATAMAAYGRSLFRTVFTGAASAAYRSSEATLRDADKGLRIRLQLQDVPELLDVPWELLYDDVAKGFVAISNRTPLIRYLGDPATATPLSVDGAVRVLVAVSSPVDLPTLDANAEFARITHALHRPIRDGRIVVDQLPTATLAELTAALKGGPYHVLHFVGHGGFDPQTQQGALGLEASDASLDVVRADELVRALVGNHPRLVVLNSCDGARSSVVDPFAGTAQALIAGGVQAVVAMQFEISDDGAIGFAEGFYDALSSGAPLDEAVTKGRLFMMGRGETAEWATPVLYCHTSDTRVFAAARPARTPDIQGRPEDLDGRRVVSKGLGVKIDTAVGVRLDLQSAPVVPHPRPPPVDVLPPPFPMLLGRDAHVDALAAQQPGQLIDVVSDPGWGKTALLRAVANRSPGATRRGLLYLRVLSRPAMDVLQFLFEAMFETDVAYKPGDAEVARLLQEVDATIVLDDVQFGTKDAVLLRRVAPRCRFLVAGGAPVVSPGDRTVALEGVPADAGRRLIELELGRSLTHAEVDDAEELVQAVHGKPSDILAAAGWAWENDRTLVEALQALSASDPPDPERGAQATRALSGGGGFAELSDDERRALGVLAAAHPAPAHLEHVIAVAPLSDPMPVLESLERRGLIRSGSPLYNLTFAPTEGQLDELDVDRWTKGLADHLQEWAGGGASSDDVLRDSDLVLTVIERVRRMGRNEDVIRLGKALEPALITGVRWGQWDAVLSNELAAATVLESLADQGWAHHQLGSRAGALGDRAAGREELSRALHIRQQIGDGPGAEATRANLEILGGATGGPREDRGRGLRRWLRGHPLAWLLGAIVLIVAGGTAAWFGLRNETATPAVIAPATLDFGAVTVGSTSDLGVTVSNQGGGELNVTDVSVDPPTQAFVASSACAGRLTRGTSCTISVTFSPADVGTVRADLLITDDAGGPAHRVGLTGSGAAQPIPAVEFDPVAVDFGKRLVGTKTESTLIMRNSGKANLHVRNVVLQSAAFSLTGGNCKGATVRPGRSCSIAVTFTPAARGPAAARLVAFDDAGSRRQAVSLAGIGIKDRPDLIVTGIERAGEPEAGDGTVDVRVSVTVQNDADVEAGVFKVSVQYTGGNLFPGSQAVANFTADPTDLVDPASGRYPFTTLPLAPGQSVTFTGVLHFYSQETGATVTVTALADSCLGDEGFPNECRVAEFDEDNNTSGPLAILLQPASPAVP